MRAAGSARRAARARRGSSRRCAASRRASPHPDEVPLAAAALATTSRAMPVPARRLDRDDDARVRQALPRGVRRARAPGRLHVPASRACGRCTRAPGACCPWWRRLVSATEIDTVTPRGRRTRGRRAEGHAARPGGGRERRRDPDLLLRAPSRPGGRRVPDVPRRGRGHAEAAGRVHDDRDRRHEGAHAQRARLRRAAGGARVPADQPPARLPRLRQGRRVPAAGPDLPLRAGQHALRAAQAHVREAGTDLAADRARPRALHPLLPLHAVLAGRRRGRAADRARARVAVDHRDLRGAPVREPVQRAT